MISLSHGGEPPALLPERDALFLDFDGTLVEIAATPDSVRPAAGLVGLLLALCGRLGGALALVSGRPLVALDGFLAPARFAAAAVHGHDLRLGDGRRLQAPVDPRLMDAARAALVAATVRHPGTRIEDKGESIALHYRLAPMAEAAVLAAARAAVAESGGRLHLLPGKMVAELVAAGHDKGTGIARLLAEPPFLGRRSVFVGDDVTDEAGFAAVNRLGGISVRVGPAGAATAAAFRLSDVATVHAWLAQAAGQDRS